MDRDYRKEFVSKRDVIGLLGTDIGAWDYVEGLLYDKYTGKEIKDFVNSPLCKAIVKREIFTEDDLEFNSYMTNKDTYLAYTVSMILHTIIDKVKALPFQDMSSVIRCGNCLYSKYNKETKSFECEKWNHPCPPDHFCASGRHKMPRI